MMSRRGWGAVSFGLALALVALSSGCVVTDALMGGGSEGAGVIGAVGNVAGTLNKGISTATNIVSVTKFVVGDLGTVAQKLADATEQTNAQPNKILSVVNKGAEGMAKGCSAVEKWVGYFLNAGSTINNALGWVAEKLGGK